MPTQENTAAITQVNGEYAISVREIDAAGKGTTFSMAIPDNVSARDASVKLRTFVLKKTTWKDYDIATILHAVLYADSMGLDIMAGDVYSAAGGRLSTTAGAKIRHAMGTGRIAGYEVEITAGPNIKIPMKSLGTYDGPNYKAKVTVLVKDWVKPVVYETTLSEWFLPQSNNPNWKDRPQYMLRRNALSKALEEVAPVGVEADEAPPVEVPRLAGAIA
jgi:hypothetical protein